MASHHKDVKEEISSGRRFGRIVNTWIGWLGSITVSLVGGLMLSWWELKYHATNDEQWMVPLGLILFLTPLLVWFSVFISDCCNPDDISIPQIHPLKNSFDDDPER